MPTLKKLLSRFGREDRIILENLIEKITSLDWYGLDIRKLHGHEDIFRLRKGKIRSIFYKHKTGIAIINIGRRSEKIYKL